MSVRKETFVMSHLFSKMVLAAALGAAASGCGKSESQPPEPKAAAAPRAQSEPKKMTAADLEHSSLETTTPFILTVTTDPVDLPESGTVQLTANLSSQNGFKAPLTLEIVLPAGAKLVAGEAKESLGQLAAGKLLRTFKVELASKPTEEAPIKIIADAKDPEGRFGAHSEKKIPEHVVHLSKPYGAGVPPPPVGRPGAGIAPRTKGTVALPKQ